MANKKFSQFDLKTNSADVQFVVGYNGTDNVRIAPSNLGGGGASDLNGLSDCLVDTDSLYVGEVSSGLSGNPQGNTIMGIDAGASLTTGIRNTFIGNGAGLSATTANENTTLGYRAGQAISDTSKNKNVCIGKGTFDVVAGQDSVIIGFEAGRVSSSSSSVYVGYQSGWGNSGASNTAIGREALNSGGGGQSVGVGYQTAKVNSAAGHTSVGFQAGFSQTSGNYNTNVGYKAGYQNTTNSYRTFLGYESGRYNSGTYNTGIGYRACNGYFSFGTGQGTGSHNTALGYKALQSLNGSSASNNTAVGSQALGAAITGGDNTAVGKFAGLQISSGAENVLLGFEAGSYVTTTSKNTFIGTKAGKGKTSGTVSGSSNVAIGSDCFTTMVSASNNVVIGYGTLGGVGEQTGNNNTFVGNMIYFNAYFSGSNTTAIGNNANPSAQNVSNEITLGNSSINTLRCAVTSITSLSDERDKSEIKDLGYGLAFIDALQPREFVWDNRPETDGEGKEFYSANKGKKDFGFIAQEVKELDNDTLRLVYDSNPDKLELSYGKLVPILVQAIKELKAEVELLKS